MVILLFTSTVKAQNKYSEYAGIYGDWVLNGKGETTKLELRSNGTFKIRTVDYVYPQTFDEYTNEGKWIINNEKGDIILNPGLEKRKPKVTIKEKEIGLKDSIKIKINHSVELYKNQKLVNTKKTEFNILTLYFNKRRKYKNLSRKNYSTGHCAWAPRIRHRINLDSTNTFKIAKKDIKKIGVFTYGFTDFIEVNIQNKKSNYFIIDIVIPIDKERMPRSKKVIIRGKRAYYYEDKGKIRRILAKPLRKKTAQNSAYKK